MRIERGVLALLGSGLLLQACVAKEAEFVLNDGHETFGWRAAAGRPAPDFHKAVVWTRHEQVGIGNALGGYARVMQDALVEDRTLVIRSLIFQKFCEVVSCPVHQLAAPGFSPDVKKGDDVTKASHFQINVNEAHPRKDEGGVLLAKFQEVAGCGKGSGPRDIAQGGSFDEPSWPVKCIYSKLVRGFIDGPGSRLVSEAGWLKQFYVGDSGRFSEAIKMNKHAASSVFDFVIHIRTLDLIEDLSTEDGFVADAAAKASRFMRSPQFETMVRCFATAVADELLSPGAHHTGARKAHHAPPLVGALHEAGLPLHIGHPTDKHGGDVRRGDRGKDEKGAEKSFEEKMVWAAAAAVAQQARVDGSGPGAGVGFDEDVGESVALDGDEDGGTRLKKKDEKKQRKFEGASVGRHKRGKERRGEAGGDDGGGGGKAVDRRRRARNRRRLAAAATTSSFATPSIGRNASSVGVGRVASVRGGASAWALDRAEEEEEAAAAAAAAAAARGHRVLRILAEAETPSEEGEGNGKEHGRKRPHHGHGQRSASDSAADTKGHAGRTVSVYLATDALDIRSEFATRLQAAVASILSHRGKHDHFIVEVDYFKETLPPAMFFLWTYPMKEMKDDDWQRLVGTTAEWVFLSQGRTMLTVKGLSGGEKALMSSFAMSAAAFGRTKSVRFLESSGPVLVRQGKPIGGEPACSWSDIAYFS